MDGREVSRASLRYVGFKKGDAIMSTNKLRMTILVGTALLFSLISTANAQERAHADLKNADGKTVGTATLRQTKEGVSISIQIKDLAPGLHAVHIHSTGKCEGPAFASAGGHFNPLNMKHGLKSPDGPHAGDLPDLYVNKDRVGRYQVVTQSVTLDAGKMSIDDSDGKSIVIHATADDNLTDPAGNSGDRIACGVIAKQAGKK
jgi:Cu-Zn family superoxide dismutase